MRGQVTKVIAGFYDILFEEKIYRVRGSGNLRKAKQNPVVGDFVEFEEDKFITKIYDRTNSLLRPKVANIDQAIIVTSLKDPDYSSILLHKFLAIIESQDITPIILFTKIDLTNERHLEEFKNQGYKTFEINNNDINTLDVLDNIFANKLSVFTGQTGAGKSKTISNLSNVERETQEISKALGRGKHTTRVVEIIPWHGGRLIDTPGFSSLDLNLTKLDLSKSFQDFRKESLKCKFTDCLHHKEIECNIKKMVESKKISKNKYNDYLRLLSEVENG